jgi:small-conductance mechanosensitive channel
MDEEDAEPGDEAAPAAAAEPAEPRPELTFSSLLEPPTKVFDFEVPLPPVAAVPATFVALVLVGLAVEKVVIGPLRRVTKRTANRIDDVLVEGLHKALRPLVVLLALNLVVQAFLPREAETVASRVLTATTIVVVAYSLIVTLSRVVDAWVLGKPQAQPLTSPLKLAVKLLAVPVVLLMVLQTFQVPVTTLVTTLGIGGLAVGLALQDTLKNIFAGIQIVLDQPFRSGDFIVIDEATKGVVYEIGLRSTKVRTMENNMLIVPNTTIANSNVVNTDTFEPVYLHRFWVGVAYHSDSRRVAQVLDEELERATQEVEGLVPGRNQVYFMEFGDSALMFRLSVGMQRYMGHRRYASELHHRIHERLAKEGIEIPFPMRTVVLRTEDQGPLVRVEPAAGRDEDAAPGG